MVGCSILRRAPPVTLWHRKSNRRHPIHPHHKVYRVHELMMEYRQETLVQLDLSRESAYVIAVALSTHQIALDQIVSVRFGLTGIPRLKLTRHLLYSGV